MSAAADDWIDEGPSDDDLDEFGDDAGPHTTPCPNCGAEMYDDAEWCPSCDQYTTRGTREWTGRPLWWVVLALAGVVATVCALSC